MEHAHGRASGRTDPHRTDCTLRDRNAPVQRTRVSGRASHRARRERSRGRDAAGLRERLREPAAVAGKARFSTWLTRIAVNEALSRARRLGKYKCFNDELSSVEPFMA